MDSRQKEAKKVRQREKRAFNSFYDLIFKSPSRKTGTDKIFVSLSRKTFEKRFFRWVQARGLYITERLNNAEHVQTELRRMEVKGKELLNDKAKPIDLFELNAVLNREIYRNLFINHLMFSMLSDVVFNVMRESNQLSDLRSMRKEMKPYIEIIKRIRKKARGKANEQLSNADINALMWQRQISRGVLI